MSGYITPKGTSYPAPQRAPASKAAAGSLWFAMSIVLVNLVMSMVTASVLSPGAAPATGWILAAIHLLVALILFSGALAFGIVGLRQTEGGATRGRGRAIAGIVVGGVLLLFAFGGMVSEIEFAYLGNLT